MKQKTLFTLLLGLTTLTPAMGQSTVEDDIWKEVNLSELDYSQRRNYCQRLYGYYRTIDDGMMYFKDRQQKMYNVYEGIFELNIRYSKEADDGANIMVGRDLVHPEKKPEFINFYELKPYTFLEKARKVPKYYTLETSGDTTRVYTKNRLAGTVVKDSCLRELRMKYDALAPDTAMNINLLIARAHLSNVQADAVYWYDDASEDYVPQGNLRSIVFEGRIDMNILGSREVFNERTEMYIDSVVYFTRDAYKADRKYSLKERRERSGYTQADIDRLKQKLGVKPLSASVLQRIEDQRDWDEEFEHWKSTNKDDARQITY